jgi:MazG family protein
MSEAIGRLREIVGTLRSPEGCPWDREQTHASLRGALLEECYEAIDAINRADDANLSEELGDLLLLVVMHARLGEERGAFQFDELVHGVCEKLIRRHPHVFGTAEAGDSTEVLRQWEQIKRQEKGGQASVLDGLAASLPGLMRAQAVQKKVGRVGFDWGEVGPVLDKIEEEARELREVLAKAELPQARREEEVGDLLFSVVNLSRKLGLEAETCLNATTEKFIRRFKVIETAAAAQGRRIEDLSLAEMDALWEQAKKGEARDG